MKFNIIISLFSIIIAIGTFSFSFANDTLKYLNIPIRSGNAITGSEFVSRVSKMSLENREKEIVKEILLGNVPSFSRKLKPVTISLNINSENYKLTFFTLCDYMAIGADSDYLYIPMTPSTAQYLAEQLNCSLPTKKMVDIIYNNADIKLYPQPIPPSNNMVTVPVFKNHTDSIKKQILQIGFDRTADYLIAGHKKDVIISNKIYSSDRDYKRVVIYGWHRGVNNPIQPVYNGHIAKYADYSHGIRFIFGTVILNGDSTTVENVLKDTTLFGLLSSEGMISKPYYPPSDIFTSVKENPERNEIDFILNQNFPNPFNPTTIITYSLFTEGFVKLKIYDSLGRTVKTLINQKQGSGNYQVIFNAKDISGGVYFYKLTSGNHTETKKMILLQ